MDLASIFALTWEDVRSSPREIRAAFVHATPEMLEIVELLAPGMRSSESNELELTKIKIVLSIQIIKKNYEYSKNKEINSISIATMYSELIELIKKIESLRSSFDSISPETAQFIHEKVSLWSYFGIQNITDQEGLLSTEIWPRDDAEQIIKSLLAPRDDKSHLLYISRISKELKEVVMKVAATALDEYSGKPQRRGDKIVVRNKGNFLDDFFIEVGTLIKLARPDVNISGHVDGFYGNAVRTIYNIISEQRSEDLPHLDRAIKKFGRYYRRQKHLRALRNHGPLTISDHKELAELTEKLDFVVAVRGSRAPT